MTKPKDISQGHLGMSLRELLTHMMERQLNHVVLIIRPDVPVRITVTVANVAQTDQITKLVESIIV